MRYRKIRSSPKEVQRVARMERRGWARIRPSLKGVEDNSLCWFELGLTQNPLRNLNDEQRKNFYCPDGRTNSCPASSLHPGYDLAAEPLS
jgi:hypothetical protein